MPDAADVAAHHKRMKTKTVDSAGSLSTREGAGRVLIMHVDEATAGTLSAALRLDGYDVEIAQDGATEPQETPPQEGEPRGLAVDVVLAELHADDIAGQRVLARARALAPSASVILLTSYATLESALRALRVGAEDYLAKPVDMDELRLAVARVMRWRRLERELAARVGELERTQAQLREGNKRLQRRVDAATAELQAKVEALDAANQQLRAAQEQHHTFVAMVAHEMRGPLGPIMNYALLAKRPAVTSEKRNEYMDIIVEHANRMNRLVDDLQTATRLSTGRFSLQRQPCDVVATVAALLTQMSTSYPERHFSFERHAEPITADVDPDRLAQAVRNLVDNAVKYSVEGGAIELSVWQDAQRVYIRVGDYGAGIPEAERERIFEPFTRLERRPETKGTGLGLYITRGIVAAHGGELSVVNRVNDERAHGAIFTIALPLHAADAAADPD